MQERGSLSLPEGAVEYRIARANRKTIKIEVSPQGEVQVTAPKRLALQSITNELIRHSSWLSRRLLQAKSMQSEYSDLLSLSSAMLCGVQIPIVVREDGKKRARLERNENALHAINCGGKLREKLLDFYRDETQKTVEALINVHASQLGVSPSLCAVKSQQRRWGSCNSRKEIRFNRLLCMMPHAVVEYVVVHELCHLKQLNHSKAFWNEVARVLPDYEQRRKFLRTVGDSLAAVYQNKD